MELGLKTVVEEVQIVSSGKVEGHGLQPQPAAVVKKVERERPGEKGAVVVGVVVHAHRLQPELD